MSHTTHRRRRVKKTTLFSALEYLGAFRCEPGTFTYASHFMHFDFARNELLLTLGNVIQRLQIIDPAHPVDSNPATYPIAPRVAGAAALDYANGTYNQITDHGGWDGVGLGAFVPLGNRIALCGTIYYDANNSQRRSWCSAVYPDDAAPTEVTPWRSIGTPTAQGYVAGPATQVPPELQAVFGGDVVSGQSGLPIISRQSTGPCAIAWKSHELLNVQELMCKTIVGYSLEHPIPGYPHGGPANEVYNTCTKITGVCFLGDRLVFVGTHGLGESCYGDPWSGEPPQPPSTCYDPDGGNKGYHAFPYRTQAWSYLIADLIKVANGELHSYDLVPAVQNLSGLFPTYGHPHYNPTPPSWVTPMSLSFNPATRLLYMPVYSQDGQGWEPGPLVHVWRVPGELPPDPPDPPIDPDDGSCTDPDCQVIITALEAEVADLNTQADALEAEVAQLSAALESANGQLDAQRTALDAIRVEANGITQHNARILDSSGGGDTTHQGTTR